MSALGGGFGGSGDKQLRMPLMETLRQAWQDPELRSRLLFVLFMFGVFVIGIHLPVPIPGVDPERVRQAIEKSPFIGLMDIFGGGALRKVSIFALGLNPYITASIIMQILTPLVPQFRALQEEGEQGRRTIQKYTHWAAVPLAMAQGYGQIIFINSQSNVDVVSNFNLVDTPLSTLATLFTLAAGTMFLVWLGELITENGIGNGISMIIFAGIVARLPSLIPNISTQSVIGMAVIGVFAVGLIYLVVFFQEAQRRVPVQYARSAFRGGRMYRQQGQSHIPLRVNMAGMIPLIFAFSIMILPVTIAQPFTSSGGFVESIADFFVSQFQGGRGGSGTGV